MYFVQALVTIVPSLQIRNNINDKKSSRSAPQAAQYTPVGGAIMEAAFLGTPDVGAGLFLALCLASFLTAFIGVVTGAAGGLLLLAFMANVLRPEVLLPLHTVIQLGQGITRTIFMRKWVMWETLLPFTIGAIIGAAAGAKLFIALPLSALQLILGIFILFVTWMPRMGRVGKVRNRFAVIGFAATFIGMFVSATGTLIAPFVAAASPDRRNHGATLGIVMAITHTLKLVAFAFAGLAIGAYVPLMAAMIVVGAAGNWLGQRVLHHVPEARFRLVFQILLTLLGLRLLWTALSSTGYL